MGVSGVVAHLDFDDVVLCTDVGSFNLFVRLYLREHGLFGADASEVYWALFYKWKESLFGRCCHG